MANETRRVVEVESCRSNLCLEDGEEDEAGDLTPEEKERQARSKEFWEAMAEYLGGK